MADTTTNEVTETETRAIATHEMIAAPDGPKVGIDEAIGIRYIDKASGEKFEFIPALPAAVVAKGVTIDDFKGSGFLMLNLFGSKTKATNETSRVRQRSGDSAAQLEALDEVFESINNGVWREKAEGGGGSRTDKPVLAACLIELLGEGAKGDVAHYVARFEADLPYMRKVLASDAGTKYRERMGRKAPAVESLA